MTISDWIVLATALLAFFRPELESLLQRWFARLEAYPVGSIELGFGGSGVIVALEGTLRAIKKDAFVRRASVTVKRHDNVKINLPWVGLRSRRIVASFQPPDPTILSPVASHIPTAIPQYYYIVFAHPESRDRVSNVLRSLRVECLERMQAEGVIPRPDETTQASVRVFEQRFLENLNKSGRWAECVELINQDCFWLPGAYELCLAVDCAEPKQTFSWSWRFRVSDKDSERLRQNATIMLFQNFGQTFALNTVEVEYNASSSSVK